MKFANDSDTIVATGYVENDKDTDLQMYMIVINNPSPYEPDFTWPAYRCFMIDDVA